MSNWPFTYKFHVIKLILLQRLLTRPTINSAVSSRTRYLVLFCSFIVFLWGTLWQDGMACTFFKLVSHEGVVLLWAGVISAHLGSDNLSRFYRGMRSPLLINNSLAQLCSHIVATRAWSLICFILASVDKVCLFADVPHLFLALRPSHTHIIIVW